jgi:hypothetical protein
MTTPNPYQTPKAAVGDGIDDSEDIEKVRTGQKMLIYAILLNFVTYGFQGAGLPVIGVLVAIGALILSLVGIFRVGSGMGFGTVAKIGLVLLMFVPLVNLITLLVLNGRATKMLREAGYAVGLLGAR